MTFMQKATYAVLFGLLFATSTAFATPGPISLSVSTENKITTSQILVNFQASDSASNAYLSGTISIDGILKGSFSCAGSVCSGVSLVDVTTLGTGHHKITVTAWDQVNNVASKTVNVLA